MMTAQVEISRLRPSIWFTSRLAVGLIMNVNPTFFPIIRRHVPQ